jgi:hypothetical protein
MPPNNYLTFVPLITRIFITSGNVMNRHFYPFINIKQNSC